ncbi:MAG TPA: glycosyltransferase [Candidatus Binatia bacterium]|nr:glycosyltransferase [Candidatus Binatia bacterium]
MEALWISIAALAAAAWLVFALSPRGFWRNREALDAAQPDEDGEPAEITALIPARNEAAVIRETLRALIDQGHGLKIIVIDDGSDDGTAEAARQASAEVRVIASAPLPPGWSGKLWALEQGRRLVATPYTLLLDADIRLERGALAALGAKMRREKISFISLMAEPHMATGWEKLLMPAFVYFFKILYPFHAVNSERAQVAAAAGGCALVESGALERIGGFAAIRGAVIDDCALADRVKSHGYKIWLGLTHSVKSARGYRGLKEIWDMVARSAFFQLGYSSARLALCTLTLLLVYVSPPLLAASSNSAARRLALAALAVMFLTYIPILRFYRRSAAWALCLPLIAGLFLAMTWTSAVRYWRGERTRWKGRVYPRERVQLSNGDSNG